MCKPVDASHRKQRGRTAPNRALSTTPNENGMIYDIKDKVPFGRLLELALQIVCAVFVATVLIPGIVGVDVPAAQVAAGVATLISLRVTNFKIPMFMSNSGNYVGLALLALATGGYTGVLICGAVICLVYCLFGLVFSKVSTDTLYKIFPKTIIGAVTCVIGFNLMGFIPGYLGETGTAGLIVCLITAIATAIYYYYIEHGVLTLFPFLLGLLTGYVAAIPMGLVDWSVFSNMSLFSVPKFAFTQLTPITLAAATSLILPSIVYGCSGSMEILSDNGCIGGICKRDFYKDPGLGKIFYGAGLSNLAGTAIGGLPQCSYGESVSTVGFSKCASTRVTATAAIMMILLGFLAPVQAFIASIPACAFAGSSLILYGFIAYSGFNQIAEGMKSGWTNKDIVIMCIVLSVGVSQIKIGNLSGVAASLVIGVVLNLLLQPKVKDWFKNKFKKN